MGHLWRVLLRATGSEEGELSCEECLVLMDCLADLLAQGYPSERIVPLAKEYLQHCPDCQAEFRQALAELEEVATRRVTPLPQTQQLVSEGR